MMLVLTGIFALLSVVLLSGKGGFLIAGYNTASVKEKTRYDEKRLCRVMGAGMSVITLILLLVIICGSEFPVWLEWLIPWGIFGTVIAMVIVTNSSYCEKKDGSIPELTEKEKQSRRRQMYVLVGILAVIGIFVSVMLWKGDVEVTLKEEEIVIDTDVIGVRDLPYKEIVTVTYCKELELGKRTGGVGSFRIQAGSFKNEEFGSYRLYSYAKCKEYIVCDTVNGKVVLNAKTPEETKELYKKIVDLL